MVVEVLFNDHMMLRILEEVFFEMFVAVLANGCLFCSPGPPLQLCCLQCVQLKMKFKTFLNLWSLNISRKKNTVGFQKKKGVSQIVRMGGQNI